MRTSAFKARLCALVAAISVTAACHAAADEVVAAADQDATATKASETAEPAAKSVRTRFILALSEKVDFQVLTLSGPNRVVVELPDVDVELPKMGDKPIGVIKAFRSGLAAPGRMRVVIDVTQPVIVDKTNITKAADGSYNLALEILPLDQALNFEAIKARSNGDAASASKTYAAPYGLGAGSLQPPLPRPASTRAERDARTFKPIIVLDPGHGGYDSGAVKLGTVEKEVVLAFSHVLRDQLEKSGRYKIMMTRDDDTFIPLDERTRYAERNKANLFIAIHADYADGGASRIRGATIYSLRDGAAKALERSTKGIVAKSVLTADELDTVKRVGDVDAVKDILADFAERDVELTHERTGMFAKTVIENMGENTPLRTDPRQQAGFRVLKTAQFPSVLIELAYVTNRDDAANLKSDAWRQKVARSIVDAIDNYFANELSRIPM